MGARDELSSRSYGRPVLGGLGRWADRRLQFILILPAGLIFVFIAAYPIGYNIYISLHRFLFIQRVFTFTGPRNYLFLFQDPVFLTSLLNTLRFVALATAVEVSLGLGLAVLFNARLRAKRLLLSISVLPMMLPTMVVCAVWAIIYDYEFGFLNNVLRSLGLEPLRWLSDPRFAMEAVTLVDVWQWTPFALLVLLAGLQSIPEDLHEAAQIDGANGVQRFRHITLPLLSFHIQIVILLRVIDTFRVFDKVYTLTGGGPGYATETITMYIFREGFRYFNLGRASAASLVMLVLILIIGALYVRRMWRGVRA